MRPLLLRSLLVGVASLTTPLWAAPPAGFEVQTVVDGLVDPATLLFSPDGRLFVAERIQGRLRVARRDPAGAWQMLPTPFATFDVPADAAGEPLRHRSSGLRDCTFDPAFLQNGYLYCFYMRDNPRHNQVVRLRAWPPSSDVESGERTVLLEIPFNDGDSSGSHNGGALAFGSDGLLYVTTGDGWVGGDNVQQLDSWTGKVFRIHPDGAIPDDNPFMALTTGDLAATYALGLRNPYSISRHPGDGSLWINDVVGGDKADVLPLVAGANYGHQGSGPGTPQARWANAGGGGARVISGGAWYPACGPFPALYHGRYFVSLYGGGALRSIRSDGTVETFDDAAGQGGNQPLYLTVGPEGHLYYLLSDYETSSGSIVELRPVGSTSSDLDHDNQIDACADAAILVAESVDRWRWNHDPDTTDYAFVRGDLTELRLGGGDLAGSVESCLAAATSSPLADDPTIPEAGNGFWYLSRPNGGPRSTWNAPAIAGGGGQRDGLLSGQACP